MEILIRKGRPEDTASFLQLLQETKDAMTEQDWFFLDPAEEICGMMAKGIMELWVAVDGDRIVGAFDLIHPGLDMNNYGYDLDFCKADLLRVVQMDTAAVHPDYRGLGLQRNLMETAEREIRQTPGRILLCTIHPDNIYSLNNVLKQGYTIEKKLPKYGSVRLFLRKDLP